MQSYSIKTDHFEGPFDLLLFFIQRDELDINDIPISKITNDFLSYIKHQESLNLEVASEFILVAATLMRIKAKMLIPRKEMDEFGTEIDPRKELTQKLLEYKSFKEVIDELHVLEEKRWQRFMRGNSPYEMQKIAQKALVDIEWESLDLYKLMNIFNRVLDRIEKDKNKTIHSIVKYDYTIESQQSYIIGILNKKTKAQFKDLFVSLENRIHAIVTFISLLELLNLQKVTIIQGEGANNFWIEKIDNDSFYTKST